MIPSMGAAGKMLSSSVKNLFQWRSTASRREEHLAGNPYHKAPAFSTHKKAPTFFGQGFWLRKLSGGTGL
jgi:hypothetical protein